MTIIVFLTQLLHLIQTKTSIQDLLITCLQTLSLPKIGLKDLNDSPFPIPDIIDLLTEYEENLECSHPESHLDFLNNQSEDHPDLYQISSLTLLEEPVANFLTKLKKRKQSSQSTTQKAKTKKSAISTSITSVPITNHIADVCSSKATTSKNNKKIFLNKTLFI